MESKILKAFDQILTIPDDTLQSVPDSFLKNMISSINIEELIEMQTLELREASLTKSQVRKLQMDLYDTLDDFKNQIDFDSLHPKKKILIEEMTEVVVNSMELAIERYEVVDARIPTRLIHENAKLPQYAHEDDGGSDVYAVEDTVVKAHTFGNLLRTGLEMQIPKGWIISVRPRSGMSKKTPVRIANTPGTIERGFYTEIGVLMDNISDQDYEIKIGDRIAQLILERRYGAAYVKVDEFDKEIDSRENIETGETGLGSTGR